MKYTREELAKAMNLELDKVSENVSHRESLNEFNIMVKFYAPLKNNPSRNETKDLISILSDKSSLANDQNGNDIFYEYLLQIKDRDFPDLLTLPLLIQERLEYTKNNLNEMFKDQIEREFSYYFSDLRSNKSKT